MEQSKALNALAPFLALTKSATSPLAAADLIDRAISAPNTYVFAELLEAPQIRALIDSQSHSSYFKLLEIFSYGTYQTYCTTPSLPELNTTQASKLRQLSFLTLAKNPANLCYDKLMRGLGLETHRELENLVISVIYAGLVEGTLDPYHERVIVTSISPLRDMEPNSIPAILNTLDLWSLRCASTLADLEKETTNIKTEALKRQRCEAARAAEIDVLIGGKTEKDDINASVIGKMYESSTTSKRGSGKLDENDEAMDVDEDGIENWNSRSLKKRGLGSR